MSYKLVLKKVLSFPFRLMALILGMAMMLNVFLSAMIHGKSIDDFCDKVDLIMDKLDELKAKKS